jgi:hypothetical protein
MAKATYVTKFDAGGSGDNLIPDGYIKTVEEIWMDTYVFTAAIPSGTSVDIAFLRKNAKITGIDILAEGLATSSTVSFGTRIASTNVTATSTFLSGATFGIGLNVRAVLNIPTVLSDDSYITMYIGGVATTTTAGTITTIVRYT